MGIGDRSLRGRDRNAVENPGEVLSRTWSSNCRAIPSGRTKSIEGTTVSTTCPRLYGHQKGRKSGKKKCHISGFPEIVDMG
jgi:hypothetical protein